MPSTTTPVLNRALVALTMLAALLVVLLPRPALAATDPGTRPLVVLGIPGLTWDDITPKGTPGLHALAQKGGTGSLVVRTVHESTCPADGWLTLGAGARATAARSGCPTPAAPSAKGVVPGWQGYKDATRDSLSGAKLGSLVGALTSRTTCAAAVGPGAALALAEPDGHVSGWSAFSPAAVTKAVARCGVVVVDLGAVRTGPTRAAQVKALDARVAQALTAAGSKADILAASLADDGTDPRLRPLVVRAPGYDGHELSSGSTKQPGLVLLTDLGPTITSMRKATAPESWTGHRVTVGAQTPAATRVDDARDLDLLGRTVHPLVGPVIAGLLGLLLLSVLIVPLLARLGVLTRGRARTVAAALLTVAGAVPAATFLAKLVPWWRASAPGVAIFALTLAIAIAVAALAWAGPWRRRPYGPVAVVALATIATLVYDVVSGGRLTISSMMGEHPVVGGRFYGLGNVSSGLLAAATLLLMAVIIEQGLEHERNRMAAVVALVLGLAVVAFTAAPELGADFGGPAALLPAVLYLALRGMGLRLGSGRIAVLGVIVAALLMIVCLLDWLRPADQRTHLGRFADSVINGGGGGDVIGRKLIQNWTIFSSSVATMAIPVVLVVVAYFVWRPSALPRKPLNPLFRRQPLLRIGLLAVFVMLAIAYVLNDSGATVPAPVAVLVLPLALVWGLLARRPASVDGSHPVEDVPTLDAPR